MIVTTGNDLPGHQITEVLNVVRGVIVRSPSITQGLAGNFKKFFGGNIAAFAKVCDTARQDAFDLMIQHATELGAHAIIAMRYDATEFSDSATEVLAYGTAVKISRE